MDTDRTSMMSGATATAFADESCKACSTTIPAGDEFCPKCGFQRGTWQGEGAVSAAAPAPSASVSPASGPALWTLSSDGQQWPLSAGTHELGRGDVAIRIDDGYASRRHAQLEVSADGVTLTDLGSSNGTFFSERRLEPNAPETLVDGATFRIANTTLALAGVQNAHVAEQESSSGGGTQVLNTEQLAAEIDSEGTSIDPDSQPEAGKEGVTPNHASESKWELTGADGTTVVIPLGEMTLGRKTDATHVIEGDSFVSGVHCRLVATIDRLELTDLNSTNGTFVNDARIDAEQPWQLTTGDVLKIGQTTFTVANNKPTEGQELEENS